jgi:hypothetical protein
VSPIGQGLLGRTLPSPIVHLKALPCRRVARAELLRLALRLFAQHCDLRLRLCQLLLSLDGSPRERLLPVDVRA